MRATIWVIVTAILFCFALWCWASNLPYSGADGTPWQDFAPRGSASMLIAFVLMLVLYCICLWLRPARSVWFVFATLSFIPTFAAFYSCWLEHRFAIDQWLHPWEGSDVGFPLYTAESTVVLSIIFDAALLDITAYGYFFRSH